jgi:uncharacterized protein YecE (DUF72 family)
MNDEKYCIGTAGFMIGGIKWLRLKSLNCIEINSTFYRNPSDTMIKAWLKYPENVKLSIKIPKYITHIKRLKDVKSAWTMLWKVLEPCKDKIISLLFQLPPSFAYTTTTLQRIKELKEYLPKNVNIVFEFRNRTWITPMIYDEIDKMNIIIASTYLKKPENSNWIGDMPSGFNFGNPDGNISYMRIHGMKGYRGELSETELRDLYKRIKIGNQKQHIIIFNNSFFKNRSHIETINGNSIGYAALYNALQMREIINTL